MVTVGNTLSVDSGGFNENQDTASQEGFASGPYFRNVAGERRRIRPERRPGTGRTPSRSRTLEAKSSLPVRASRAQAPIGSNLVTVGVTELEKTAATNLSTLVNTIPALSTNGSLAQGENLWSFYSPQIHQLGGSSSNTTLVVIDGMRTPGGGAQFNQIDPNIIPTSAMQRVDVLADGASSVYGSDAVAGVVNFVTRRTFEGLADQYVVRHGRRLRHLGSERHLGQHLGNRRRLRGGSIQPCLGIVRGGPRLGQPRRLSRRGRLQHQQLHLRARNHPRDGRQQRHGTRAEA